MAALSFHPTSPGWVLLNKSARISDLRNGTTARCHTREGQAVEVSFWLVAPPDLSYFSVHCPGLRHDDYHHPPYLICAGAAFALFCVILNVPPGGSIHHFVYTARGSAGKPSLHLLPDPYPEVATFIAQKFGLLPCGEDHYAVAFLDHQRASHDLPSYDYYAYVFSSETRAWRRSKAVSLQHLSPSDKALFDGHSTFKHITVGATSLGWVDLLRGILLLCNLFDDHPVIKYIPFPASRVRITDNDNIPYCTPEYFCDVTCCDDLIKFAEIDFDDPERRSSGQGWKANIWNRKVSWNDWRKRSTVDVAQISVDQSYSALLPELLDDETQQLQLKKLDFHFPTLSLHDDDTLYLMATVNDEDDKAWVIALDMKHAALEALVPFSTKWFSFILTYCPCAFPKYLNNMTPDVCRQPREIEKVCKHCKKEDRIKEKWQQGRSDPNNSGGTSQQQQQQKKKKKKRKRKKKARFPDRWLEQSYLVHFVGYVLIAIIIKALYHLVLM